MGICPYPRLGERLAPSLLRELLEVPIPRVGRSAVDCDARLRLCDLDETAWQRFKPSECLQLAEAVVQRVNQQAPVLHLHMGGKKLPRPPRGIGVADLELGQRAYTCLSGLGRLQTPDDWHRLTLHTLLSMPSFGVSALVDFLAAYEGYLHRSAAGENSRQQQQYTRRLEEQTLRDWVQKPTVIMPRTIMSLPLPPVAHGATLQDLDLKNRTFKCLEMAGYGQDLAALAGQKVRDLLRIPGFGSDCVSDLVAALWRWRPGGPARDEQTLRSWVHRPTQSLFRRIQDLPLPPVLHGATLPDLQLKNGTFKCLEKAGYDGNLAALGGQKVGELLQISRFGEDCLRDLLAALRRPVVPRPAPQTVEEELHGLLRRSRLNRRQSKIVARRLGLDRMGGAPLRRTGADFGISKERVRQFCAVVRARAKRDGMNLPLLDRGVEIVVGLLPRDAVEIEAALLSAGLTRKRFRVEVLGRAMALLGRPVLFHVASSRGRRLVVPPKTWSHMPRLVDLMAGGSTAWNVTSAEELGRISPIVGVSRKVNVRRGIGNVAHVAATLKRKTGQPWDLGFIRRILSGLKNCVWLDQAPGWFWFPDMRTNPLRRRIAKVLAVAGSIDLLELHGALARSYERKEWLPPPRVLLAFCRQMPRYRVHKTRITAHPPIPWRGTLNKSEALMARVLKEHGSAMPNPELADACRRLGLSYGTLAANLKRSPIIKTLETGVYGLWGVKPHLRN